MCSERAVDAVEAPCTPATPHAWLEPLLLLAYVAALGWPFLDARVVPMHDTFYCFSNFHLFYSHFYFHGDLLQWQPYGAYGLPAALQQVISFSPLDYAAALLGRLLGIRDALLLFKLARLGETLVFAWGTWLAARALFAHRATALALGIAAAGTVVWYAQIWFELRFFYLLPAVLYCVARFDASREPAWLWASALLCIAWALGNVPYFIPLWTFTLAVIVAPLALRWRGDVLRVFRPSRLNLCLAAAAIAAAAAFLYLTLHALDFLVIREPGRDAFSSKVDLETFRTWGGRVSLEALGRSFLFGAPVHLPWSMGRDNSAYVGLLPWVGVACAVLREWRRSWFAGLALAALALVWLSLGGVFATLVYYVPLVSQYRHITLVYGLVKTLVILAAGFGLERLWTAAPATRRAAGLVAGTLLLASLWLLPAAWEQAWVVRVWLYAALGAAAVALAGTPRAGLLLALALDLSLYQRDVRAVVPVLGADSAAAERAVRVHPLGWQPERSARPEIDAPDPERALGALAIGMHARDTILYWTTWGLAQFDPCGIRSINTNTTTWGVDTLLRLDVEEDVDVRDALACKAPKLRLASEPVLARTFPQALAHWTPGVGAAPFRDVIRVPPRHALPAAAGAATRGSGSVRVTRFDADRLTAEVEVTPPGAWLVYADAFHPRWHAYLDGREVFIAEANLAFKAVWVPAGTHDVEFRYAASLASYVVAGFGACIGLALPGAVFALATTGRLRS